MSLPAPTAPHIAGNAAEMPAASPDPVRRVKSEELLQHLRELEIDHEGRIYRLRVTQLNKLILTA